MPETPRMLWHYTCDHGAAGIQREGIIRPNLHPLLGVPVAWFTDLDPAHRFEIGLTSDRLACDRMAHRFATADRLVWWPLAARSLRVPAPVRAELETGRLPAHWWVSLTEVAITGGGDG
ncbi:hypothetical protein AB0C10_37560 [Microbispora amethystogenes]|uniref:hypothetical protein n=1 Tax=Microbispora amethystogenes TaxID=1427754 RepID=UPI0033D91218